MRVYVKDSCSERDVAVEIRCQQVDNRIRKLKRYIEKFDETLTGKANGEEVRLQTREILYIEAVDNKVFLYTANSVYETPLKLYELETILDAQDFFRCNKSTIVNISQIVSLRPELTRNVRATMTNGEVVIISRRSVKAFTELIRSENTDTTAPSDAARATDSTGVPGATASVTATTIADADLAANESAAQATKAEGGNS